MTEQLSSTVPKVHQEHRSRPHYTNTATIFMGAYTSSNRNTDASRRIPDSVSQRWALVATLHIASNHRTPVARPVHAVAPYLSGAALGNSSGSSASLQPALVASAGHAHAQRDDILTALMALLPLLLVPSAAVRAAVQVSITTSATRSSRASRSSGRLPFPPMPGAGLPGAIAPR